MSRAQRYYGNVRCPLTCCERGRSFHLDTLKENCVQSMPFRCHTFARASLRDDPKESRLRILPYRGRRTVSAKHAWQTSCEERRECTHLQRMSWDPRRTRT